MENISHGKPCNMHTLEWISWNFIDIRIHYNIFLHYTYVKALEASKQIHFRTFTGFARWLTWCALLARTHSQFKTINICAGIPLNTHSLSIEHINKLHGLEKNRKIDSEKYRAENIVCHSVNTLGNSIAFSKSTMVGNKL